MVAPDRLLEQRQPGDVLREVAARETQRRKAMHVTQKALAERSGVSLASIRRFEQGHEIALASLVAIGFALGCEGDFDALFARPYYASIEDVVRAGEKAARDRRATGDGARAARAPRGEAS